jgi:NADPH:quinone reductase-like Zn-dependent oxidoreductase
LLLTWVTRKRVWTAVQCLFHTPRLTLKGHPESIPHESAPWVLIYSGATSVGQYAVQLARLSGYRVVTTASPKNFALLKSLGADVVFDYHDRDVSQKIKLATGDDLSFGLDTISDSNTIGHAVNSFGKNGGELVVLLPVKDLEQLRPDVQIKGKPPPYLVY